MRGEDMTSCCPRRWHKFFKAACDKHRQSVLDLLRRHHKLNASQIVQKMKISQPTISHHLKILCDASIVKAEKKGKEVFYSLNKQNIANCCSGFMKRFSKNCK